MRFFWSFLLFLFLFFWSIVDRSVWYTAIGFRRQFMRHFLTQLHSKQQWIIAGAFLPKMLFGLNPLCNATWENALTSAPPWKTGRLQTKHDLNHPIFTSKLYERSRRMNIESRPAHAFGWQWTRGYHRPEKPNKLHRQHSIQFVSLPLQQQRKFASKTVDSYGASEK
jgi:hypothetical protein